MAGKFESRGESMAIILGDCIEARILSMRLRILGLSCVICDRSRSPFGMLIPVCGFERLYHSDGCGVIITQLEDIVPDGKEDAMSFIVACKKEYTDFLESNLKELEDSFIVVGKKEIVPLLRAH